MAAKKHLLIMGALNGIIMYHTCVLWAATPNIQKPLRLHSANAFSEISGQQDTSAGSGKIAGKVTNTDGLPLSDITISIQSLTEETTYGSDFEDVAATNKKGKFKITGLTPGKYIVRATPSSDEFYLPNDKFKVTVKSKKTKNIKIRLSAASHISSEYVGSTVCLGCHPEHKGWEDTAHAKTIGTPSSETIVAPYNGEIITTSDSKVKFKPFIENNEYKVTLYDLTDESISVTYSIARTHGGVAVVGKQRYQVKIGNSHYILPIQYNNRNVDESNPNDAWVSYNPSNWYNSDNTLIATDADTPPDKNKSFEQNCEGCHVTGLGVTRNADGEFVSSSKETGISCESCHGPGELHVSEGGGKSRHIVNPEYLATDRGNEVCGQCHIRVKNKTGESGADFETEYPCIINGEEITPFIPGKILANYIEETTSDGKPTAGYWNDNDTATLGGNASENNHSQKHHQQYQDLTKSYHYNYAGLKCYTCHEPHGSGVSGTAQLLRQSDNNKLCINCHGDLAKTMKRDGELQNKHAKHLYSSTNVGGSLCTGCHMPKTAKSAVDNDISSHVFDIIKPYTSKAMADSNTAAGKTNSPSTVITNSCYGCHSDEDTDYSVDRWNTWEKED
ncbi:MAG: carboxypeptidase regulatory-like domain-containing protein [Planctomycetes bacterium]|nr:carboxypeptidase regulatory-like domain-containing protein [Planctomycetota bacterium]